ncbi:unnamed protein product [Cyclocybe aegerita]|uniref:Uncharacterized protein n=1 Tax=Cyclocybe aegerita TaxID=1973307 RepID=A0A8S0X0R6_CYCAE|nr:unnamed protein product [Cyclocybe aegerita]
MARAEDLASVEGVAGTSQIRKVVIGKRRIPRQLRAGFVIRTAKKNKEPCQKARGGPIVMYVENGVYGQVDRELVLHLDREEIKHTGRSLTTRLPIVPTQNVGYT